jgi:ubiquinone/menaquinone biosynthesis C-methylase UbiE
MRLSEAWERNAEHWVRWAREPGHDSYWRFHRDAFLALLPPSGELTVDVGCGEGRLSRDLKKLGHRVIGVDASPAMLAAAREADPDGDYLQADAAALPLEDACADLVVAFMSLQDVDDMGTAVAETARILRSGGRLCLAVVHPINSAGSFESDDADATFRIEGSYFESRRYTDLIQRAGLRMAFASYHHSLETYLRALEDAGFHCEAVREPVPPAASMRTERWRRLPLFMHVRAVKPEG